MADASPITERLPPELLQKILTCSSVPDVLRLKQVNRHLRDFIQHSTYIEYRTDLFASGLADNPASHLTLAKKRKAFNAYRKKWEKLRPVKKWQRTVGSADDDHRTRALGVYAFIPDSSDFVEFFTLESVSRAIPRKEWKTPLPGGPFSSFAINPQSDVLVVAVERNPGGYALHLLSMTSGQPHPAAETPIITHSCIINSRHRRRSRPSSSMSITNSRLAVLLGPGGSGTEVVVWDWRTGRIVLERTDWCCFQVGLIDEHWLIVLSGAREEDPERLLMFDTERGSTADPIETSFHLPPSGVSNWFLSFEPCGHILSPDEQMTSPFYPDPCQRILALSLGHSDTYYVITRELLLELARRWVNQNIGWDQWRAQIIEVVVEDRERMWITGCQLFFITRDDEQSGSKTSLQLYDLSPRGRANSMLKPTRADEGGGVSRMSQSPAKIKLPWDALDICAVTSGHDSILFCLENGDYVPMTEEIHVWSF